MHEVAPINPWVALAYLASGILFIMALRGLSSPASSRRGNRFGPGFRSFGAEAEGDGFSVAGKVKRRAFRTHICHRRPGEAAPDAAAQDQVLRFEQGLHLIRLAPDLRVNQRLAPHRDISELRHGPRGRFHNRGAVRHIQCRPRGPYVGKPPLAVPARAFREVADGVRFELTVGMNPRRFSRPVP